MIVGLSNTLPTTLLHGLTSHGVSATQAHAIATIPVVGSLFASFLGYNPLQSLLVSQSASHLSNSQWSLLTGKQFFPNLITQPFHHGLVIVFSMALAMALIGSLLSALRGKRYVHEVHHQGADEKKNS
jgi:hypothetical protein